MSSIGFRYVVLRVRPIISCYGRLITIEQLPARDPTRSFGSHLSAAALAKVGFITLSLAPGQVHRTQARSLTTY
jgi:hypothetical protein